ncbi:MAG TPA: S8 family peptidase [Pseudoxanthomonas sp.]
MVVAGTPSAFAAGVPVVTRKAPISIKDTATASDRIVVRYKTGTVAPQDRATKIYKVTSAASRVGVQQKAASATLRTAAVPLGATHVRRMGVGADVIKLSRKLNAAEQTKLIAEIAADPSVAYVNVVHRAYPMAPAPNDTYYAGYQWHLQNTTGGINAPGAWDYSTGAGVVVAVLDTGILTGHPDKPVNLLPGYDFISDAATSGRAGDGRVAGAEDLGDWTTADQCYTGWVARESSWHGSHVAGTVAEATNNALGMAGVAYNATVLPVRVLGHCGGWEDDIADAIVWASGGHVDGVPDNTNPAEVINMSLGGSGGCAAREFYQDAIDVATANGSLVVVAAGNDGANASGYSPSSCNNVVAVGATGYTGQKASYSNYGNAVDLSAPGGAGTEGVPNGFIWQAWYDGTTTNTSGTYSYIGMTGTSMASPHVAAVAALVQSALVANGKNPLPPAELETLLKTTARVFPVTPLASTPIGTGIVNPVAALEKALEEPCDPTAGPCSPVAIALVNKTSVTGLSGTAGSEALYSFEATSGSVLNILTLGGTGNVSVYVSFEEEPTTTDYDFSSVRPGNSETVRVTAPRVGTYYIKLKGAAAYSGVTLVARQ